LGLAVGEVVAFTGCRSDQTSADVGDVHAQFDVSHAANGVQAADHAGGALTAVLLESLDGDAFEPGNLTYLELLERMRTRLHQEGFSQVPQLVSSLLVELQHRFSLCTAFVPPDPSKARGPGGSSGFDATDGAIAAGGAACAAGFLAALAASPHGGPMLREATTSSGWAPYRDMDFCSGGEHQHGFSALTTWGNMYSGEEPPVTLVQAEQPLTVGGHIAEPLLSWGQAEDPPENHLASRDHASEPLVSWGQPANIHDPLENHIASRDHTSEPLLSWGQPEKIHDPSENHLASRDLASEPLVSWGQPEKIHEPVNTTPAPSSDPLLLGEGPMEAWGSSNNVSLGAEPPSSSNQLASAEPLASWGEPELEEESLGMPDGGKEGDGDDEEDDDDEDDDDDGNGIGLDDDDDVEDFDYVGDEDYDGEEL